MFSKIITLMLILFVASCGSKKATTSVKLKLFKGNMTVSAATNGGVVIVGRSDDGKNSFRMGVPNTSTVLSLDLVKGKWEFAAISWEGGNGPLTGINRCAYTGLVDLTDADSSVSFSLASIRCASDFSGRQFSQVDYINSSTGIFYDFVPVMCMNATLNQTNCAYGTNPTVFSSYKVVFNADKKGDVGGTLSSLSSSCLPIGGTPRAKMPITDSGNNSPFGATTVFYASSDCSGAPIVYDFKDGFKDNQTQPVPNFMDYIPTYYSLLMINPGPAFEKPVNAVAFTFSNGLYDNGMVYLNTPSISYYISSIPAGVDKMCFTKTGVCSAGDWITPTASGNLTIPGGDGAFGLSLFFKTAAGNVGAPYVSPFVLDTLAPVGYNLGTILSSVGSGVIIPWTNGAEANYKQIELRVYADASYTTLIGSHLITTVTNTDLFTTGELSGGLTLSQVIYIKMIVTDKAGNSIVAGSGSAVTGM